MISAPEHLVYLADAQIPSRATNAMQVMRMCAAFSENGMDVTLVHPYRFGNSPEGFEGDVGRFYGVSETFRRVTLPTPLTLSLSGHRRLARATRALPLSLWLVARSRPRATPYVVYSRSLAGAWLAIQARRIWGRRSACKGVYLELHDAPTTRAARDTVSGADGLVVISGALRRGLLEAGILAAADAQVEHDGVDLTTAGRGDGKAVRLALGINRGTTVVGYTGRVNAGKGVGTIIRAAQILADRPIAFLVVGKRYEEYAQTRPSANVTMTGFVPPSQVPDYVAASDIVLMPTSATLPYSRFTSPLKLFEYMASRRPLICSDLPVLREVVQHEMNGLLVAPDDEVALAAAIDRLRLEPTLRQKLAKHALGDVQTYSWNNRAKRILSWMEAQPVTTSL